MRTTNLNLVTNSGKNYRLSRVNIFFFGSNNLRAKLSVQQINKESNALRSKTKKLSQLRLFEILTLKKEPENSTKEFSELKKPFYN